MFRSRADAVPLTVAVLDRRGVPVTGLTADDFTILEDGQQRDLVAFHPHAFQPGATSTTASPVSPAGRRTFLLVLGFGRIQHPTKALDGAIAFVRDRLTPQDAVAVMAFHRTTAFTTDHAAVVRVLERFKTEHERLVSDITRHMFMSRAPYGRGGAPIPNAMLAEVDASVFHGSAEGDKAESDPPVLALRNTTDLLLAMDLTPPTGDKPWRQQLTFQDVHESLERAGITVTDGVIRSDRLKFLAAVEYLRRMEGEKRVVFLSGQTISAPAPETDLAAARANSARVVVDYVWTTGTRGGLRASFAGCGPCREVSELIGGVYTSVDYATDALARVDAATRAAYLIGYVPAGGAGDGRYRKIAVKVNRPDVTVLVRRGYYDEPPIDPEDAKETTIAARVDAALVFTEEAKDIDVRATAAVRPGSGTLRVDVRIDPASLALTLRDGARTGQVEIEVHCGSTKEKVVGSLRQRLDLSATAETWPAWVADGIRRQFDVAVSEPPRYVKVVVYDYGSDRVGSVTLDLRPRR